MLSISDLVCIKHELVITESPAGCLVLFNNNIICVRQPAKAGSQSRSVRSKNTNWTSTNSSSLSWPSWLVSSILNVASALSLATSWTGLSWLTGTDWCAGADTLPCWLPAPRTYRWSPPPSQSWTQSLTRKYKITQFSLNIYEKLSWGYVWILKFFSSFEVFYYVYREMEKKVSESQCSVPADLKSQYHTSWKPNAIFLLSLIHLLVELPTWIPKVTKSFNTIFLFVKTVCKPNWSQTLTRLGRLFNTLRIFGWLGGLW